MTWTKLGNEFSNECSHVDLSDAAYRTHVEAIEYVYSVEAMNCRFSAKAVRKFASSDHADNAVRELLDHGFWSQTDGTYELQHHADVIRQSITAQQKQRATSKATSAKYRQKKAGNDSPETPEVTRHVTPDADSQTDKHLDGDHRTTCRHEFKPGLLTDPWKRETGCSDCQQMQRSA